MIPPVEGDKKENVKCMENTYIIIGIVLLVLVSGMIFYLCTRPKHVKEYFDNGNVRLSYYLKKSKKVGKETFYYPTGEVNKERYYVDGIMQGPFKIYFKNKKLYIQGQYKDGQYWGEYVVYNIDGTIRSKIDGSQVLNNK